MSQFLKKLFDTDFMPHGQCFLWRPEVVWVWFESRPHQGTTFRFSLPLRPADQSDTTLMNDEADLEAARPESAPTASSTAR